MATATRGRIPTTARAGFDPYRDVPRAQDLAREGVQAFGDQLRPQFEKQVGDVLGGLNSIGGLRSGGTQVALNDLSRTYADTVGTHARASTLEAIGSGLAASGARQENRRMDLYERELKDKRRAALLGSIGTVLGAGVGFLAAGPPGAAVGASAAGKVGQ